LAISSISFVVSDDALVGTFHRTRALAGQRHDRTV